jgi:hypothetical protein
MKSEIKDQAKRMAKDKSLEMQDEAIFIIYCNRTKYYYVTTDSLIRNWERLIGYYENGIYHKENQVNK